MIGRVYRGSKVGGLVRYLYGPGRHNEHVDQRLVAAWCGSDPHVLATVEPAWLSGVADVGDRDFRGLIAELEAPMAYAGRVDENPIWHCPLRTAPGDRVLTDAEWADVAADLMHRTGIAPRGDEGACRWIAVRHDDESIHVVAVLARQDGARAHVFRDYPQVRATCLAAEQKYGLTVTAPADRTAATHSTRAEAERARRTGHRQPARDWLREQVQLAAAGTRDAASFLDELRAAGVAVRERHAPDGALTGYAVARRESDRDLVFYGGGKLAYDLTLLKLERRWAGSLDGDVTPAVGDLLAESRELLWRDAATAAADAAAAMREQADSGDTSDWTAAGDAAAAAAEVLTVASRAVEGEGGGPLTRAASAYDRASREVDGRTPVRTTGGQMLRRAALHLARGGGVRPGETVQVALLVAQIGSLSLSVSRLRAAQGRAAQAAAARRAASAVAQAADQWSAKVRDEVAAHRPQAALSEASPTSRSGSTTGARPTHPQVKRSR